MSNHSEWPLPSGAIRFFIPTNLAKQLQAHPLSARLHPTMMGFYPEAKAHHIAREQHKDFILIYCVKGSGSLVTPRTRYKVAQGCIILIPEGMAYELTASKEDPWSLYWIHFEGELAEWHWANAGFTEDKVMLPIGVLPKLVQEFENFLDIRHSGYSLPGFIYGSNMLASMLCYVGILSPKLQTHRSTELNLERIHLIMQEKLHSQIDLDSLASSANLSKFAFARKYKELTGTSPIQAFINLKMRHACYLLDISSKNVSEISRNLGYDDAYYFSRIFKKVIGMSPSQYRAIRSS